jgi:hypothetical protein
VDKKEDAQDVAFEEVEGLLRIYNVISRARREKVYLGRTKSFSGIE